MVEVGEEVCPDCGQLLKYYDHVDRIIKTKYGKKEKLQIRRLKCNYCKSIHREITDEVIPYKHYEKEIIQGFVEGLLTSDILEFEDYPCDLTVRSWIDEFSLTSFLQTNSSIVK